MGQPYQANLDNVPLKRWDEQTSGSETSQYREEKRPIGIPLVAASETGKAQTQPHRQGRASSDECRGDATMHFLAPRASHLEAVSVNGGYKATALATGKVKKCVDRGTSWEARPQRVIVPYSKSKHLYGCSS